MQATDPPRRKGVAEADPPGGCRRKCTTGYDQGRTGVQDAAYESDGDAVAGGVQGARGRCGGADRAAGGHGHRWGGPATAVRPAVLRPLARSPGDARPADRRTGEAPGGRVHDRDRLVPPEASDAPPPGRAGPGRPSPSLSVHSTAGAPPSDRGPPASAHRGPAGASREGASAERDRVRPARSAFPDRNEYRVPLRRRGRRPLGGTRAEPRRRRSCRVGEGVRTRSTLPGALHDVRATCGHGVVDALAQAVPPCITPAQAQDEKSHRPVPEIAVVFPPCEPRSAFTWC